MWGFVRKLSSIVPQYVEARRRRCPPTEEDPAAYGAGFAPNPPHELNAPSSSSSSSSDCGDGELFGGSSSEAPRRDAYKPRNKSLHKAAAVMVLGGIALAVGVARGGSGSSGGEGKRVRRQRRHEVRREGRVAQMLVE